MTRKEIDKMLSEYRKGRCTVCGKPNDEFKSYKLCAHCRNAERERTRRKKEEKKSKYKNQF